MTEDSTPKANDEQRAGTEPMREISHTNPYTDQPFGSACAFERGPTVAADGGERDAADVTPDDDQVTDVTPVEEQTVEDVSHTPPHDDGTSVDRVFERGTEGRDETV